MIHLNQSVVNFLSLAESLLPNLLTSPHKHSNPSDSDSDVNSPPSKTEKQATQQHKLQQPPPIPATITNLKRILSKRKKSSRSNTRSSSSSNSRSNSNNRKKSANKKQQLDSEEYAYVVSTLGKQTVVQRSPSNAQIRGIPHNVHSHTSEGQLYNAEQHPLDEETAMHVRIRHQMCQPGEV